MTGLLQGAGTSFILVFINGVALSTTYFTLTNILRPSESPRSPRRGFFKNLFIRNITFHGFRPTGSCKKLAVPVFRGIESACVGPRERHDSWGPGADPGFRRGGGVRTSEGGGGFVQNFRSGSKLLQGPGQINKQKKLQTAVGGGFRSPPKKPVSAHGAPCTNSRNGPRTSPKVVKTIPDKLW